LLSEKNALIKAIIASTIKAIALPRIQHQKFIYLEQLNATHASLLEAKIADCRSDDQRSTHPNKTGLKNNRI
jgi:hypothetical protein